MSWIRFLKRARWDKERSKEIDAYLEIETADNIARGMTPADARSAAHRKFGNPTLIREEIYRMNTVTWFESIVQDLRHGLRTMIANPGFSLIAILSLALGIGANTAIFQLVDAVSLRTLPIKNPRELAQIEIIGGNRGMGLTDGFSDLTRPMWEEIRRDHSPFSGVFAWSTERISVGEARIFTSRAESLSAANFFACSAWSPGAAASSLLKTSTRALAIQPPSAMPSGKISSAAARSTETQSCSSTAGSARSSVSRRHHSLD